MKSIAAVMANHRIGTRYNKKPTGMNLELFKTKAQFAWNQIIIIMIMQCLESKIDRKYQGFGSKISIFVREKHCP